MADPGNAKVSHMFHRRNDGVELETKVEDTVYRAVLEYAVGSGDRGLTWVGHDDLGNSRVVRMSLYADRSMWDLTPPVDPRPRGAAWVHWPTATAPTPFSLHSVPHDEHARPRRPKFAGGGRPRDRVRAPPWAGGQPRRAIALELAEPAIAVPRLGVGRADQPAVRQLPQFRRPRDQPGRASFCAISHDHARREPLLHRELRRPLLPDLSRPAPECRDSHVFLRVAMPGLPRRRERCRSHRTPGD